MTQIKATVIQDSRCRYTDTRITTFELEYPRFIHSEFMTHKMLGKNCASSRAIPIHKNIDQVRDNAAGPIYWGKNQAGMQAAEEMPLMDLIHCKLWWQDCANRAIVSAQSGQELGLHKQIVNRVLEPFVWMKTVVTGTEYNNLFWLRRDKGAQPEFKRLADLAYEAREASIPTLLYENEWHVPYVNRVRHGMENDDFVYSSNNDILTVEQALKLSASMCAQTSYRKSDDSLEKAYDIYNRLVESEPVHASPFEHQAMCYNINSLKLLQAMAGGHTIKKGITHIDMRLNWWSGNLKHFIQHRQLIPNNAKYG